MTSPHLAFHHLGLAVRRPDEAMAFHSIPGYHVGKPIFYLGQNVHLAMCSPETEAAVEFIWPHETERFIHGVKERPPACVIYHVCYTTDNLGLALAGLEKEGTRVICAPPPKPATLFGRRKVSFYNVAGIGLIEILELAI